jgi:hypothetical protein
MSEVLGRTFDQQLFDQQLMCAGTLVHTSDVRHVLGSLSGDADQKPREVRIVIASGLVEVLRDLSEHPSSRPDVRRSHPTEGLRHRLFHRSARRPRIGGGAGLESESRAPAVSRVAFALQQPPRDESLQNPGNRARVQADDVRQRSRRQAGKLPHDPQHESLRSRDPQFVLHPFRHPLEAMLNGPEESHEIQDRLEAKRGVGRGIR